MTYWGLRRRATPQSGVGKATGRFDRSCVEGPGRKARAESGRDSENRLVEIVRIFTAPTRRIKAFGASVVERRNAKVERQMLVFGITRAVVNAELHDEPSRAWLTDASMRASNSGGSGPAIAAPTHSASS